MIIREERIGGQRLILGDCREVMPLLGRFDAVVTDPPYGIGAAAGIGGGGTDATGRWKRRPRQYHGSWDDERPSADAFFAMAQLASEHIIWGGNFFADILPIGGRWLIWDKMNSMPSYSDAELAWTSIAGSSVKKFTQCASGPAANRDGRAHPTQKPVALMEWCLGFIPAAQIILDPYMGSGTTLVACQRTGRNGTGIELDPEYFEIACRRVDEAGRQPDLLIKAPQPQPVQRGFDL
ncbi:DNA-methyltransferase [Rhodobacter capsulatus]|uniref:DNA-methyltransferase n=1 Tax=Rhodobacter capsulatus TaxID=1061 RepID=UPI00402637C4